MLRYNILPPLLRYIAPNTLSELRASRRSQKRGDIIVNMWDCWEEGEEGEEYDRIKKVENQSWGSRLQ